MSKALLALAAALLLAVPAYAAPKVSNGGVVFKKSATDAEIKDVAAQLANQKQKKTLTTLTVEQIDNAALARLAKAFPTVTTLNVKQSAITDLKALAEFKSLITLNLNKLTAPVDLAPLSGLTTVKQLSIEEVNLTNTDLGFLAPLTKVTRLALRKTPATLTSIKGINALTGITYLSFKDSVIKDLGPVAYCKEIVDADFNYSTIDDLTPLAILPKLKHINFYGAKIKDFSPLAGCPALQTLNYYAAKMPNDDFSSLGNLKQVKDLRGGLTEMTSIEWIKNVPQLERFTMFTEKVADLSPLAAAVKLKYLRAWQMKLGDMAYLRQLDGLQTLELPSSEFTATATLEFLPELEKVDMSDAKKTVDLNFVKKCAKIKNLNLKKANVANFAAIANHPALETINLSETSGANDLELLLTCPKLKTLIISKDTHNDEKIKTLLLNAKKAHRKITVRN